MKLKQLTRWQKAGLVALLVLLVAVSAFLVSYKNTRQMREYPLKYTEEVARWAAEYELDPYLVYAVIWTESGFRPEVESAVGARGLMQMTGDTFDWVKGKIAPDEALTFDDLYRPEVAIRFGSYYLSQCLQRYGGDIPTAAAAYHSGWGTVDALLKDAAHTGDGVTLQSFPHQQMSHYVYKVNDAYQIYTDLYT